MTEETKHVYAISANVPSSEGKDSPFEQFAKKDAVDTTSSRLSDSPDGALIAKKAFPLHGKEKETPSQREAVIRPQQAGKIDFKALHNRTKFPSDASWNNGKNCPPSPTGKSRGKDKNKKSGKGDRTPHQLYRLSINSSRSNPTIGIAYPQQKVTPPKNVEVSRGPASGSYRFHIPSISEREAELHQEDLNFSRPLSDSSPSLTSINYTSQTAARTLHSPKLQLGNLHDTVNPNGQFRYLDFQLNGNTWLPSEKYFSGANEYGISSQKLSSKSDLHSSGPVSFQYSFQSLQETTANSLCNNRTNQGFVDVSNQVAHNSLSFQHSSRGGLEDPQGNGSYNAVLPDSQTYGLPSQQAPFLHSQQGAPHPPTPPCYTGRSEHSADLNGAISLSGALTSSGAIEQTQSTFQENQSVFNPGEFSLRGTNVPACINKRQQPPKDSVHGPQRVLNPGNTLQRNIPQSSLNKVHFPGKVYNSGTQSMAFDKSHIRIPQAWDAVSNSFPSMEENSVSYLNTSEILTPYKCQSNPQRQALKTSRVPWQQVPLTSAARHTGNQKLPFSLSSADWQNNNIMTKIPPSYHAKKHLLVEGNSTPRTDHVRHSFNLKNDILYNSMKDTSDSRAKGILYNMPQPIHQSQHNSVHPVTLSGKSVIAESPCESPLPSPVIKPVSGSSCSSLSPMSSSPLNQSPGENQGPPTVASSPYFHQPRHAPEKSFHPTDLISSGSLVYHNPEAKNSFRYVSDASKDDEPYTNLQKNHYQKLVSVPSTCGLENFESEPPPPYSSHHFLASSLSSANLDQLDVLLTCKQCDENFSNLSSFLEHRQYCSLNAALQTELKDSLHIGDNRKSAADPLKISPATPSLPLSKGQTDFNSQLFGFSKDYLLESDNKVDTKEDLIKNSIFHNGTPSILPLTACDTLEMDDAKLDSLIIEALNGLEFQVGNPDIDSTFIDVFVDDDLSTPKASASNQVNKTKIPTETSKKLITEKNQAQLNQVSHVHEDHYAPELSYDHKTTIKIQNEPKSTEIGIAHLYSADMEKNSTNHFTPAKPEDYKLLKRGNLKKCIRRETKKNSLNENDLECPNEKDIKSYNAHKERIIRPDPQDFPVTENPKSRRMGLRDLKKRKSHSGTWSKELIHKIVQQKNKLHKLHVKSNKNGHFSLVTERLFPPTKSHPFGAYDYISDSDEDVATSLPGKTQPTGKLKYSFNRDLPGRGGRAKVKETVWRMGEATRFQLQNKDNCKKIRRRSSQSSNSSDQSPSISSETGSSPKSIGQTDSENEQETAQVCKGFTECGQKILMGRNLIKPLYKENISDKTTHAPDFSKGSKRFESDQFLLAKSKECTSIVNTKTTSAEKDNYEEDNSSNTAEANDFKKTKVKGSLRTYQDTLTASIVSQGHSTTNLILDIENMSQEFSLLPTENLDYQKKQINSASIAPTVINAEINPPTKYLTEGLCDVHKDFEIPCYTEGSSVNILPIKDHKINTSKCKNIPGLHPDNILKRSQNVASTDIEQIYTDQSHHSNINSLEHKLYTSSNSTKVSSTLSFDSTSIFELPISDFESPLYNNNMPPSKNNYEEFEVARKPTDFQQELPQFLQVKSWDLIDEGGSILSNSVTQFQVTDKQMPEKYSGHIPMLSEERSMELPKPITDYNVPFLNNVSEDELEIKRLVTELENQLQSSTVHNDTTSQTLITHQISPAHTNPSLSTFSDMGINPHEHCRGDSYFHENPDSSKDINKSMHSEVAKSHLQDPHPLVKMNNCENLKRSWTCPGQFDTLNVGIQCHKQNRALECFLNTETHVQYPSTMSHGEETESPSNNLNSRFSDLSNQIGSSVVFSKHEDINKTFAMAERLLSKAEETKDLNENQQDPNENPFTEQKQDDQFDDPPQLEPFRSAAELDPAFIVQTDSAPVLNMTSPPEHNDASEKTLSDPSLQTTDTMHSKTPLLLHDEILQNNGISAPEHLTLLDMPVLEKEENTIPEKFSAATESPRNPLQQLQQFVARTAKNNEEEMLMPCFPALLSASDPADLENNTPHSLESKTSFVGESESNLKTAEQFADSRMYPAITVNDLHSKDRNAGIILESISDDKERDDKQLEHLDGERSGLDVDVSTCGIEKEHCKILPEWKDTKKIPLGQVNVSEEGSNGGKNEDQSPMEKRKTTNSINAFHKETFSIVSIMSMPNIQNGSTDRTDDHCLPQGILNKKEEHIAKHTENQEPQGLNIVSIFVDEQNHQADMGILPRTCMTNNEISEARDDKCEISDTADKSVTHFMSHSSNDEVVRANDNDCETQMHTLSIPTARSLVRLELDPHRSLKEVLPHESSFTTDDSGSPETHETSNTSLSEASNLPEAELIKHKITGTDVQLFLSEERNETPSMESSQKLSAEKNSTIPTVDDDQARCFYSELIGPHYKTPQSVTDVIPECQAIQTDKTNPIYSEKGNQNLSVLHNGRHTKDLQTALETSRHCQKKDALKCDWNNTSGGSNTERIFPSEEDRSKAIVCDSMDTLHPEPVNFDCRPGTDRTDAQLIRPFDNVVMAENNVINEEDPEKRCASDMHSVVDGVLRILEGDKSKEILQSIGISQKSSPNKDHKPKASSITCDICAVSFRSKPGLTRHKAVKHNGSITSHKDGKINDKSLYVTNTTSEWDSNNQINLHSDSKSQNMTVDFIKPDINLLSQLSPEAVPQSEVFKGDNRTNRHMEDTGSKKKINSKVKKKKMKVSNKSIDSQVPSDDVLNILKTNILKAIEQSNSFSSAEEKIKWQESSNKNIVGQETSLERARSETYTPALSIDDDDDDDDENLVSDLLHLEMKREHFLAEPKWTKSLAGHVEPIINDSTIQPRECQLSNDQALVSGGEESLHAAQASTVQTLCTETVTDLHTFFHDDNTFSQLFPRDEQYIRRKCTRVYGKRNRRQTPTCETEFSHADVMEHCQSSKVDYTQDYRNIPKPVDDRDSSDHPKFSQHRHHMSPKNSTDVHENQMLSFICHGQTEKRNAPSQTEKSPDGKDKDASSHVSLYKLPEEAIDSELRDSEVEEAHNFKSGEDTGLPEFPTIDMKMLSAKFDMRELSFFSACGDYSDQSDLDMPDITQKVGKHKRHGKSVNKKQMRNRNNVKMKTRDKQYKCKVCFQWFLTLGELDFHKLTHNPSPPPTCYMCVQRKFSSREQLRDHLKDKHAKNKAGLWICGMCLKEITDVWMYNEHLREHATQFARKGQAQKSVMGLPGCFGEESMVRTFLSTFIYRTPSKSLKNSEVSDKSPLSNRPEQKEHKTEDVSEKDAETSDYKVHPAPTHIKLSVSSSEGFQKSNISHKNAAIHPHCKDPSRDCHHCGKQFPKPFKLQRHLVVHSLQKIYLCHQCPKFYPEVQELKNHLNSKHQLLEKAEIKHTTLYACELCADVMHVIKKSFICSTCNYTFSKKEQYDRHMEKHLIGGSLTFKFRGVSRPTTAGKDSPSNESVPPSKKQKTSNYSHTHSDMGGVNQDDRPQCPKLSPSVTFEKDAGESVDNEHESPVKTEEMFLDAPELDNKRKKEPYIPALCSVTPNPRVGKVDTDIVSDTLPILEEVTASSPLCEAMEDSEYSKMIEISPHRQTLCNQVTGMEEHLNVQPMKAEDEGSHHAEEFTSCRDSPRELNDMVEDKGSDLRERPLDEKGTVTVTSPKEKSLVMDINAMTKDAKGLKRNRFVNQQNGWGATQTSSTASNGDDVLNSSTFKPRKACTSKEKTTCQEKVTKKAAASNVTKNNNTDIKTATEPQKLQLKKRQEQKTPSQKGNVASQENLAEVKRKKQKLTGTVTTGSLGNAKKPDWINSLSDTKDEVLCSRSHPKLHTADVSGHFKKCALDTHNQKKFNSQFRNREYKCQKALLTKSLPPVALKSSGLSLNSLSHKRKLGQHTKPTEPSNYRTAESQNNLLSQLFGQKLTSFKIPLRRDITE